MTSKTLNSAKLLTLALGGAAALAVGCGGGGTESADGGLSGTVRVDGSSTVFPITAAMAEEFQLENPGVTIPVSVSGTGGGFKKFVAGETDINNASRIVKSSELELMEQNSVEFIELPVAYDGVTVIVNPDNQFVDYLTVEELNTIWKPDSEVSMWSDIRPEWPDSEIHLFGAGTDSGTFDYFTEAITGESGAVRTDFTATEDDNLIVQGVMGDEFALGFLGFAYYIENQESLRSVPIKDGEGDPVKPSMETIRKSTYTPLSRPVFIYVNAESAERPEVDAFVNFYFDIAEEIVPEVGYVPLPQEAYDLVRARFEEGVTGTVFDEDVDTVGMSIEDLLAAERAD